MSIYVCVFGRFSHICVCVYLHGRVCVSFVFVLESVGKLNSNRKLECNAKVFAIFVWTFDRLSPCRCWPKLCVGKSQKKKINKIWKNTKTQYSKSLAHYAMKQMLFRISQPADIFKCMLIHMWVCVPMRRKCICLCVRIW